MAVTKGSSKRVPSSSIIFWSCDSVVVGVVVSGRDVVDIDDVERFMVDVSGDLDTFNHLCNVLLYLLL